MIVIPSDHLIFDEERFREIISFACEVGMKDYLITIGIAPTEATLVTVIFIMGMKILQTRYKSLSGA